MSVLFDHCLMVHPEQSARIENKRTAYTIGSLQKILKWMLLLEFIKAILKPHNPADKLKELAKLMNDVFQLLPSGKHIVSTELAALEATASLQSGSDG
ncbi:MAG: hypothetical protein IBX55_19290 [Methyloprofundus sp.]|nr:hypothetical protein [Methyloprofundus sp.]